MATVYTSKGEEVVVDAIEAQLSIFIGWGTGAGSPGKGSTDVSTPANEARVAATESQPSADKNRWVATLTSASAQTITNAGAFDGAGSGTPPSGANLIVVGDHTGVVLAIGDKIEYTIDLEQT